MKGLIVQTLSWGLVLAILAGALALLMLVAHVPTSVPLWPGVVLLLLAVSRIVA